jgi:hypothetical protein
VADPVSWFLIEPGWTVLDRERGDAGKVEQVLGDPELDIFSGLVITGLLAPSRYVPAESVSEISEGEVRLELTREQIEALEEYRPD